MTTSPDDKETRGSLASRRRWKKAITQQTCGIISAAGNASFILNPQASL
jgi:hypothetical protein